MYLDPKVALCTLVICFAARGVARVEVAGYKAFCACIILTSLNNTPNATPANRLLQDLSDTLDTSDQEKCNTWNAYPNYTITEFANRYGKPTTNISESAGIFAPELYAFCGPSKVEEKFSFPDFSASTAGLLLPWVAIFAQLPRQTGSNHNDILSIFISIGSPFRILSSIALAILYRFEIRTRFGRLHKKILSHNDTFIYSHLAEVCSAASLVLQAFDQGPIRLSSRPGFLSSLITYPENYWWWIAAAKDFKALRRKVDVLFIVAILIAVFGWVLAIIANFGSLPSSANSNSFEWQISMGSLWLWVFAATFGAVANKSLYKSGAMSKTLSSPGEKRVHFHFALQNGDFINERTQTAIVQQSELIPINLRSHWQNANDFNKEDKKTFNHTSIPKFWVFSVEGDAKNEGLSNFPGRFFATWQSSHHIVRGFESLYNRLKEKEVPHAVQDKNTTLKTGVAENIADESEPNSLRHIFDGIELGTVGDVLPVGIWDSKKPLDQNLRGTPQELDRYLNIDVNHFMAYPEWRDIIWHQWIRFVVANFFGLVIQWCTSAPAIIVMFSSPPVGLGCDSGSLLIYAVLATLSWLLLNIGDLFSHQAVLYYQRYQHHHYKYPNRPIFSRYKLTRYHTICCITAIGARWLGKFFAIINAFWILIWSFLTYTNVLETPWCTTAYFSLSNHGWMRLWDFDPQQFIDVNVRELQCLVFGSIIAYYACVLMVPLTSTRKYRWIMTASLGVLYPVLVTPLYFYGVSQIRRLRDDEVDHTIGQA